MLVEKMESTAATKANTADSTESKLANSANIEATTDCIVDYSASIADLTASMPGYLDCNLPSAKSECMLATLDCIAAKLDYTCHLDFEPTTTEPSNLVKLESTMG